ncbi:MAG: bifunctional 5,10-methylenetetrahydrofolate dehydrogenase/5,10-methenyltetrahydrofolate cyclohydrolase [FCB group bacterium]|nr:bifunctional 5,10-methylenetetrahydrofolate dehydrogenase/5,10-methenyltetrahydrofolate cyclohydrolase [FCB group bacterium]
MPTILLAGKPVAAEIKTGLAQRINELKEQGITPGLAAILVGENPASQIYVRSKEKAFRIAGCHSETFRLSGDSPEAKLLKLIEDLNRDPRFHGILVQLPLPDHIDTKKVLYRILPEKDVDGFHPVNLGKLLEGAPGFIPCTPHGILKILEYYKISVKGRHAVIIGRSNIVGKPLFALLSQKSKTGNATVTLCHSATPEIARFTRQADLLIAASGVPGLINGSMLKAGVDIVDVGINRIADDSAKGYHITGDVDFESVRGIANSITPVPGGVGPMTITMLLYNTVTAAENLFDSQN